MVALIGSASQDNEVEVDDVDYVDYVEVEDVGGDYEGGDKI